MKKTILIILMIFGGINVNAETFYTNYELESSNQTELLENINDDLYKIDSKTAYNNYKNIRTDEGYYKLNYAPFYLKYQDLNDYIIKTEYSTYLIESPTQYTTNLLYNMTNIKSIVLRSFIAQGEIQEINIFYDNEPVNYTINTDLPYNDLNLEETKIVITCNFTYDATKLKINLKLKNETKTRFAFMIDIYETEYRKTKPRDYFSNELYLETTSVDYWVNFLKSDDYSNFLSNIPWANLNRHSKNITYYKDEIKYYKYYNLYRSYLNEYTKIPIDGYLLDENDSKSLYDYYKREFIELRDFITNKDELNNIVTNTSIPLDKINISYYYKENNYQDLLIVLEYLDYRFYKKYLIPKGLLNPINNQDNFIDDNNNKTDNYNQIIINDELDNSLNDNILVELDKQTEIVKSNNLNTSYHNYKKNKLVTKEISSKSEPVTETETIKYTVTKTTLTTEEQNCKLLYFIILIIIIILIILICIILLKKYHKKILVLSKRFKKSKIGPIFIKRRKNVKN